LNVHEKLGPGGGKNKVVGVAAVSRAGPADGLVNPAGDFPGFDTGY
jgi:hypothetical protein